MRKISIIVFLAVLVIAFSCSQHKMKTPYTVAFYNVENLFDTIDTPDKFDEEFTPESYKEWNTVRYEKKLADLAKVICSIDTVNLPVLLGVAEIENDVVLNDLINQASLKKAKYNIVWHDGPDFRGIDCALLYNPSVFKVDETEFIPILNPANPEFKTREVVYVKGNLNKETVHVFVNHWPSRRGGAEVSEPNRVLVAQVVRKKVDEIFAADANANIIIMGDMNDEPTNMSLSDVLMANSNDVVPENNQLVNLMYDDCRKGLGSYRYRGDWDMIDNMIVSGALINKTKGLKTTLDNGYIFHKPFMEFVDKNGETSPNRTYGRSYYGGISDHFPIYMTLN